MIMPFQKGNKIRLGKKFTEETKKKLRLARAGKKPALGYRFSEESKKRMSINKTGKNNGNYGYLKNNVKYAALHLWVRKYLPQPESCEYCNQNPSYDLANVTGIYNRGFDNWRYLCRSCHIKLDGRIFNLKQYA